MVKGKVSVIIPNYNYAKYLREAIDSVLEQTYRDIEIIVVDDGSTDDSRDVLESYGSQIKTIFQHNQGVSAARNNGVAIADGEFVAFLDADDSWFAEKLEKQIEVFLHDPQAGMVHVGVAEVDGDDNIIIERRDGMDGWVANDLLRFEKPVILGGGSGIVLPRKIFNDVGRFDHRLSTSADWDLFFRVASLYRVRFVSDVLLKYRIHGSNMHGQIQVMEHDMMLSYEKAFANASRTTADRNECYGNLHKTLAGSYYTSSGYLKFLQHAAKSIWYKPAHLSYFFSYPWRLFNRSR